MHRGPIYLTGFRNQATDRLSTMAGSDMPLGILIQPWTRDYLPYSHIYPWCGIDNGCFTEAGRDRFVLSDYLEMTREALLRWGDHLLFATAPDVPMDWAGTLQASLPVLPLIRQVGAMAALVLQDGATPENIPWHACDSIFIGGSTEWKIGPEVQRICRYARRLPRGGPGIHMGRVNSLKRLLVAASFGCDSVDGTYLMHETKKGQSSAGVDTMLFWLREMHKRAAPPMGYNPPPF